MEGLTMSDTQARHAGVITIENPHQDEVTKAWSKVDVYAERAKGSDDEIARMKAKVKRAQDDVASAKLSLEHAVADKETRKAELDAAKAELAAVEDANPDLAVEVKARRAAVKAQQRKELSDKLAQLEGN